MRPPVHIGAACFRHTRITRDGQQCSAPYFGRTTVSFTQGIDEDGQDVMSQAFTAGKSAFMDLRHLQFRKQIALFIGLQFTQAGKVIYMLAGFEKTGICQRDAVGFGFIGQDRGMRFRQSSQLSMPFCLKEEFFLSLEFVQAE